ncbi:hypothetical protein [uncultured Bifidobacterium sp.]|uniref:hypothetical protein n=1 Tax=uncultured Bifidobacterium sp. TaxID=165187 RepID=UPI00280B6BA7|nr:hypothetical protein [uncultured Bifidobacterium sp.]
MGVLLNGARVGEPVIGADGQPVFFNALYNGVQVWPPAAETLVDVWLKPAEFTSQALYSDHPELKMAAQKVYADGHIEDADDCVLSCSDATVATIDDANLLSFISNPTTMLAALKNDAYQPAIIGVNAPDSTGRMTVIYRSPYTATTLVTMYWRVLTDAASDSQPHGNVTMTSLGNGLFKGAFDYDGESGFNLAFLRDNNKWSNPPTQSATARRFAYVDDVSVSYPPSASKHVLVQPDQPATAPVGSLWCRTEKTHNNLRYYTGSVGGDANVMCFLLDRIREVWRREWDGWKLLTGKEL